MKVKPLHKKYKYLEFELFIYIQNIANIMNDLGGKWKNLTSKGKFVYNFFINFCPKK